MLDSVSAVVQYLQVCDFLFATGNSVTDVHHQEILHLHHLAKYCRPNSCDLGHVAVPQEVYRRICLGQSCHSDPRAQ